MPFRDRLDVMASESHFADHLVPVYLALPAWHRGRAIARNPRVQAQFRSHGIDASLGPIAGSSAILVASIGDLRTMRRHGRERVALMEHGSGQSYGGSMGSARHPSYAGGLHRDADLFLHPGEHPANRDRMRYPRARIEIVGSPFLDSMPQHEPQADAPVVALASHFDATISPEAGSGFAWIRIALASLAKHYKVLGHGHPRIIDRLDPWYRKHGIEVVRDFREVLRRADLFIADNTSAMFAFAASGRPVVVLNPPFYRRNIHHGLRFWDAAHVGVNVNKPGDLLAAVARALADEPQDALLREDALGLVYAYRSGAAKRAARVLTSWSAPAWARAQQMVTA